MMSLTLNNETPRYHLTSKKIQVKRLAHMIIYVHMFFSIFIILWWSRSDHRTQCVLNSVH